MHTYSSIWVLPLVCDQLKWATLFENTNSPRPAPSNCQYVNGWVGFHAHHPSPCWDLVFHRLMQALCLLSHCCEFICTNTMLFPCNYTLPQAFIFFLPSFPQWSLSHERKIFGINLPLTVVIFIRFSLAYQAQNNDRDLLLNMKTWT